MTIVAFGGLIYTGSIVIYIYIMDINTIAPYLWNKSQKIGGELLISEIAGDVFDYPVMLIFIPIYLLNIMVSSTQTLTQIKLQLLAM